MINLSPIQYEGNEYKPIDLNKSGSIEKEHEYFKKDAKGNFTEQVKDTAMQNKLDEIYKKRLGINIQASEIIEEFDLYIKTTYDIETLLNKYTWTADAHPGVKESNKSRGADITLKHPNRKDLYIKIIFTYRQDMKKTKIAVISIGSKYRENVNWGIKSNDPLYKKIKKLHTDLTKYAEKLNNTKNISQVDKNKLWQNFTLINKNSF